ncbi:MAG: ComEC/Rec2 family competence protein [Rhizobiaceae bacterium]
MATDLVLKVLRAKKGDCLILQADGATVLIDGGPGGVFRAFLEPVLEELRPGAGINKESQPIDLMMVSHIDDDHIAGILDLLRKLEAQNQAQQNPIVEIFQAWHNSFADIVGGVAAPTGAVKAEAASLSAAMTELLGEETSHSTELVLAGVAQGRELKLHLDAQGIPTNQGFQDELVAQRAGVAFTSMTGGLSITVIGPSKAELDALKAKWKTELPAILAKKNSASAAEVAEAKERALKLDKSVANLSSIVCVAAVNGKRALLTGDARGDMIMPWLVEAGYMQAGETVMFDIVKLPHHGSHYNISPEFFRTVLATHYVVSGDGEHGNPEPTALQWLFEARPELDYTVWMTYGPDQLMQHPKFRKAGNDQALSNLLTPERRAVLRFPDGQEIFMDVEV